MKDTLQAWGAPHTSSCASVVSEGWVERVRRLPGDTIEERSELAEGWSRHRLETGREVGMVIECIVANSAVAVVLCS